MVSSTTSSVKIKNLKDQLAFFFKTTAKDWNFCNYLQNTHDELDKSKLTRIKFVLNQFKNDLLTLGLRAETPEPIKLFLKNFKKSSKFSDGEFRSRYVTNNSSTTIQHQPIVISGSNNHITQNNYQSGGKRPCPFDDSQARREEEKEDDDDDREAKKLTFFERWVFFVDQTRKDSDIRSYSPIDYNIIRCGKGISSRPGYPKVLYDDHVKWHKSEKKHPFVSTHANYIDNIVDSETLTEFEAHAGAKEEDDNVSEEEYLFLCSLFKIMIRLYKSKVPMTSTESVYNYYAVHPMVELVCNSVDESGGCGFLPGEAALRAMKNINETNQAEYDDLTDAIVK